MADTQIQPTRLRNARACEACRVSKSRCIYKEANEVCQRCAQNRSQCIIRDKARPMRTRANRASAIGNNAGGRGFVLDLPTIPLKDISQEVEELQSHHRALLDEDGNDEDHNKSTHLSLPPTLIKSRKVTLQHAEKLLATFRGIQDSYPFVKISPSDTVPSLSRFSPFLLLSILTVSSKGDSKLYYQMDYEFRRVLSQKLLIEGRKSLEYLQGLLIYLAWSPLPTNPKIQVLTYLNLAVSLVNELGLEAEYPNPLRFVPVDTTGLIEEGEFTRAAKQAYLGCYFISSIASLSSQKPNSFPYSNVIELRGAEITTKDPTCESYYMIKLIRFWGRLAEAFASVNRRDGPRDVLPNGEMTLQIFLNEFQEYKRSTPDSIRNLSHVAMQERYINLLIYGCYLGLGFARISNLKAPQYHSRPENILHDFQCLEAAKGLFDHMLSMPEELFLSYTCSQWTFVAMSFVILSRLTFAMAADMGWDANATRSNVPMVMYLDCLCWRFQSLCAKSGISNDPAACCYDTLFILQKVMEALKKSYSKRVAKIQPQIVPIIITEQPVITRGHCPMKDPELHDVFNPAAAQSLDAHTPTGNAFTGNVPVYFDIWSTMTGSWAAKTDGYEGWPGGELAGANVSEGGQVTMDFPV